jgi:predicted RecA/RadA family phage recombinase
MSDIIINVDDPEVVITDEYSTDYDLPIASSSTLGGVKIGDNVNITSDGTISIPTASADNAGVIKVGANLSIDENGVLSGQAGGNVTIDSALSTTSTNPVQNRVITNSLNSLSSDIGDVSSSVSSLSGEVSNLTNTVTTLGATVTSQGNTISGLETSVSANTNNISTNTSNIASNTSDITSLDTRLDTAEDNITALGNGLGQLQGNVDPVLVKDEIVIPYSSIDVAWASGSLTIVRRGFTGFATLVLTGNLVLADSTPVSIYQITGDNIPTYETYGSLLSDDGDILINVLTSGYITIQNISGSSKTVTKLFGTVPIVFA